jgi:hypothetical protein
MGWQIAFPTTKGNWTLQSTTHFTVKGTRSENGSDYLHYPLTHPFTSEDLNPA